MQPQVDIRSENSCTNVMRYAGCDGDYEPCKRNGNAQLPAGKSCQDCVQFRPFEAFQDLADQQLGQVSCIDAPESGNCSSSTTKLMAIN